jgi:nickel-type superoxide dismutase maturation protease
MDVPPSDEPVRVPVTVATYHRGRKRITAAGTGAVVVAGVAVAFLRWKPFRVAIDGASMIPTLLPGDWALAVAGAVPKRGDVVVVEHPGRPGYEMVKRLTAVPGDRVDERVLGGDEFWVEGDHRASSTDSRHFGPIHRGELKAKVLLVYWPRERRRMLRG